MAEKKLSKKALNKSFRNWFYGHLTCFSQEHMQTFGYLCAMLPLVEELYDTKEEQTEALKTYSAFFNTEPQLGTVIVGMTAGLEEAKANGEDIDGEMINGIRAGLMGPVAGIGDSLLVGTLIPILLGVALGLSSGGSPLGAIFYIIAYNVILTLGMRLLYFKGYELGGKAVEMIVGEKANAIRESIIMLGTVVIGAVAASWISITTPLVLPGDISLQKDVLDTIFPKLLPLATVMLCYWLMSKKKWRRRLLCSCWSVLRWSAYWLDSLIRSLHTDSDSLRLYHTFTPLAAERNRSAAAVQERSFLNEQDRITARGQTAAAGPSAAFPLEANRYAALLLRGGAGLVGHRGQRIALRGRRVRRDYRAGVRGLRGCDRTGHPQRKPQCREHPVGGRTGIKEESL